MRDKACKKKDDRKARIDRRECEKVRDGGKKHARKTEMNTLV